MIYLFNTPVLTAYGNYRFAGPISVEEARSLIAQGFTSAVGHEGAAVFLSNLLGTLIPANRVPIAMVPGDKALILRIKGRFPEGAVFSASELLDIPHELGLLERID